LICELIERPVCLGIKNDFFIGSIRLSDFRIPKYEIVGVAGGIYSFEPAATISEPNNHVSTMKQVRPDQISRAIVVNVSREQRSVSSASWPKMKK
jgi:hypothetical protein